MSLTKAREDFVSTAFLSGYEKEALRQLRQLILDLMDIYEQGDYEVPLIKAYNALDQSMKDDLGIT